jgi:hypothetical protein
MAKLKNPDPGYRLPAVIDPGEYVCAKVQVPADQLYIAAFWASIEYLTKWVAWERDDTGRAAEAAALWKECWDQSRSWWDESKSCEEQQMDVRQKPDEPCVLQKDTGEGWEDFADIRLCVPPMRLIWGVLSQWDGNEWVPATLPGEEDIPVDDRYDGPILPAFEADPVDGQCIAASSAAAWLNEIVNLRMQDKVDDLALFSIGNNVIRDILLWVNVGGWLSALMDLIEDILSSLTPAIAQDIIDYDIIDELKCALLCAYADDGTVIDGMFSIMRDNVKDERDAHTGAEAAKWSWALLYMDYIGPVGMSKISGAVTVGSPDCSGCDACTSDWVYEFDFEVKKYGWELDFDPDYPLGEYHYGEGCVGVLTERVYWDVGVHARKTFDASAITGMKVTYHWVEGDINVWNWTCLIMRLVNEGSSVWAYSRGKHNIVAGQYVELNQSMSVTADEVRFWIASMHWPYASGDKGYCCMVRCQLRGTGTNPFI